MFSQNPCYWELEPNERIEYIFNYLSNGHSREEFNISAIIENKSEDYIRRVGEVLNELSLATLLTPKNVDKVVRLANSSIDSIPEVSRFYNMLNSTELKNQQHIFDFMMTSDIKKLKQINFHLREILLYYPPLNHEKFQNIMNAPPFEASALIERFFNAPNNLLSHHTEGEEKYILLLAEYINTLDPRTIQQTLCEHIKTRKSGQTSPPKKIELLLLFSDSNTCPLAMIELRDVIRLRQKICREKGNMLIVLPHNAYQALVKSSLPILEITKLSFLHHYSQEGRNSIFNPKDLSYAEKAGKYARNLPDLKEMVLRACATTSPIKPQKTYALILLKNTKNIENTVINENSIVILQKFKHGQLTTQVKYIDPNTNQETIKNIPDMMKKHNSINDFSETELQNISTICGISLKSSHVEDTDQSDSKELISSFFGKSFQNPDAMERDNIKKVKQLAVRARTETREDFGSEPSIARTVREKLLEDKCNGITVKAYIGGYAVLQDRVIPDRSHDYHKYPKAIRVHVTANHCMPEVKEIKEMTDTPTLVTAPVVTPPCRYSPALFPTQVQPASFSHHVPPDYIPLFLEQTTRRPS